jgi:hypothetical protein
MSSPARPPDDAFATLQDPKYFDQTPVRKSPSRNSQDLGSKELLAKHNENISRLAAAFGLTTDLLSSAKKLDQTPDSITR